MNDFRLSQLALVGGCLRTNFALQQTARNSADGEKENYGEESAAGAGIHRQTKPPDGMCGTGLVTVFPCFGIPICRKRSKVSPRKFRPARFRKAINMD